MCSYGECKSRTISNVNNWSETEQIHVVDLDDYSKSSQGHPKIVILNSPSTVTIVNKPTTPFTFGNISVKCKRSNVFSPILKALGKNNKMLVNVMECINVT
jgi:uncharacterized protein YbcV (DUF1398 family)